MEARPTWIAAAIAAAAPAAGAASSTAIAWAGCACSAAARPPAAATRRLRMGQRMGRTSAMVISMGAILAGCGSDPPLDSDGVQLASAAVQVSGGLETACTSASVLGAVDFGRGANQEAVDVAVE